MFREIVTHSGGVTEGTASEAHAESLLRRAVQRGYRIEATPDGGVTITWIVNTFRTPHGTEGRAVILTPFMPVGKALTEATRADLDLIHKSPADYATDANGARVISGLFWSIPQGATARLRARKLVTEDDGPVRLTLTARLALFATSHRTHTTEPAGWYRPADRGIASAGLNKPGGRAGHLYSRTSTAVCQCGYTKVCEDRDEARRDAAEHRATAATTFVKTLPVLASLA
ncbi:hypothetical protein [Embleya sp. NPDC001921]